MDSEFVSQKPEEKLNDTGQNSIVTVPGHLSCEEEYIIQENSRETTVLSDSDSDIMVGKCSLASPLNRTDSSSLQSEGDTSSRSTQDGNERGLLDISEMDQLRSRTAESVDEVEQNVGGVFEVQESLGVKPRIVINSEEQQTSNVESVDDEDMDPLLAVDDTESQSSDLINFDTVSYDVIHQLGVDDDDDEKSIATVSSLSCDIIVDSLQKHSLASNSSSLVNLLDSSLKETSGLDRSISPQMMVGGLGSVGSSCSSSPSRHSSKNTSSAIDDSTSDPILNPPTDHDGTSTQLKPQSEEISLQGVIQPAEALSSDFRNVTSQSYDGFPSPRDQDIKDGDHVSSSSNATDSLDGIALGVVENSPVVQQENSHDKSTCIGENLNNTFNVSLPQHLSANSTNEICTDGRPTDRRTASEANTSVLNEINGGCVYNSATHSHLSMVESTSLHNDMVSNSERSDQLCVICSGDDSELASCEYHTLDSSKDLTAQSPIENQDSKILSNTDDSQRKEKSDETNSTAKVATCSCESIEISDEGCDVRGSCDLDGVPAVLTEKNIQTCIEEPSQEYDSAAELVHGGPVTPPTVDDGLVLGRINVEIVPNFSSQEVVAEVPMCVNAEIVSNITNEEIVADISAALRHSSSSLSTDTVTPEPSNQVKIVLSGPEAQLCCGHSADETSVVLCNEERAAQDSMDVIASYPSIQEKIVISNSRSQTLCDENVNEISEDLTQEYSAVSASSPLIKIAQNFSNDADIFSSVVASETLNDELVTAQSASLIRNLGTEDKNSISSKFNCDVEDICNKILTDFEVCHIEKTADCSQDVKTPSPVNSDRTISEGSSQPKTFGGVSDTTEACYVEVLPLDEVRSKDQDVPAESGSPAPVHSNADKLHNVHPKSTSENNSVQVADIKQIHLKKDVTEDAEKVSGSKSSESQIFALESAQHEDNSSVSEPCRKSDVKCIFGTGASSQSAVLSNAEVVQSEINRDMSISNVRFLEPLSVTSDRPESLPDISLSNSSLKKIISVDLSKFWSISHNIDPCSAIFPQEIDLEHSKNVKQFNAAALDEAQQTASLIVDDVLQKAILRVKEKLFDLQKVDHGLVFDVNGVTAGNLERKDSNSCSSLTDPSRIGATTNQEDAVSSTPSQDKGDVNIEQDKSLSEQHQEETFLTCSNISSDSGQNLFDENVSERTYISEGDSLNESFDSEDRKEQESTISLKGDSSDFSRGSKSSLIETDLEFHSQASQPVEDIDLAVQKCEEPYNQARQLVDDIIDLAVQKCEEPHKQARQVVDDTIDLAVQKCEEPHNQARQLVDSIIDLAVQKCEEPYYQASELVDSIIDLAVQKCEEPHSETNQLVAGEQSHSQANQLVDGVIEAVQKCEDYHSQVTELVDGIIDLAVETYEESLSTEAKSMKPTSLLLDDDFSQEDEELATPCGEMLTEHFMDFESGRNVSVFCSIPESGSEDHLLAYDRIVNTIGNREVDSDTGKSVSVFRSEEVFYEIQRASTCTSVFESVEEEDEDMIDTTVPVENRSDMTLPSSKLSKNEKRDIADDNFNKDCDAFEDAVDAFLTKERLARDDLKSTADLVEDEFSMCDDVTLIRRTDNDHGEDATCTVMCVKHPEYDLSNKEEKKRMAEKWANGGESEVPNTPEMHAKQKAIREALDSEEDVAAKLCKLALTEGGLINDALRREAWPRMLGLDPTLQIDAPSLEDLKSHPEYEQVVLDVNRSLKRFPPDIPKDQRETLQDKLTRLIMYVISKHPHLRYYQGYHDVAVTFLLVVGESIAFQIMERLSTEHLSDCMQPTMERTSYLLLFIYPLIHRLHPTLAEYLERSEVGTMFCLPWFLTWFGHSLDRYQDVVRLYDHFLASPPLAPLYLAAVLVAHRADEVLAVDCDMAAVHALLSHIPDTLPLEILLRDATDLYVRFPPESIEREVEERFRNEQESRALGIERQRQRALRRRRGNNQGSGSWQLVEFQDRIGPALNRWIPPWVVQQQRLSVRLLFASATFFVGFYVYSRGGDMLPYP